MLSFFHLFLQISLLDSAVNHLKANLKSAADLINLPTTVEELQKVKGKKDIFKVNTLCQTYYLLFIIILFPGRA